MSDAATAAPDRSGLRCMGLDKHFGALHVTRDLDLQVLTGQVHALIGPNGAGKTTALAQLSGELVSDGGTIQLDGRDITPLSLPDRVQAGIARSYQISSIFRTFTVRENVELALQAGDRHSFRFFRPASANRARRAQAEVLLDRVGLAEVPNLLASSLAHGQTRQLEIAMALASEPKVVLLDEPMAGIAPREAGGLTRLIADLADDMAVLLVEHDMDVVFAISATITVLDEGRKVAEGTPAQIRADAAVQELYLQDGPADPAGHAHRPEEPTDAAR
ncbi:MAG TPA: ABC transporter ATP-binding protein [Euzebya sp.]|nr:ABC transporter ATP-binding protein [Euzebya sp.]